MRYKLTYDGMWHLDIPKTRQYDHGKVQVVARNSSGEAVAETTLDVKDRLDDYRNVLKNSPRRKFYTPRNSLINTYFIYSVCCGIFYGYSRLSASVLLLDNDFFSAWYIRMPNENHQIMKKKIIFIFYLL